MLKELMKHLESKLSEQGKKSYEVGTRKGFVGTPKAPKK